MEKDHGRFRTKGKIVSSKFKVGDFVTFMYEGIQGSGIIQGDKEYSPSKSRYSIFTLGHGKTAWYEEEELTHVKSDCESLVKYLQVFTNQLSAAKWLLMDLEGELEKGT